MEITIEAITQATHVGETVIQIFSEMDLGPDIRVSKENGQQQFFVFSRWYDTPSPVFSVTKGTQTDYLKLTLLVTSVDSQYSHS